jgi:tetratricopeptide (TPR) repeat protein
VSYFEQALTAFQHLPERREMLEQAIDIRFDICASLVPLGEYDRILSYLREAETLAKALGDHRRLGQIYAYLTQYYWVTGDQDQSMESGQRALAFALEVSTNFYLGRTYHALGDYRRAIEALSLKALSPADEAAGERVGVRGNPSGSARPWLVWSLAEIGAFAEGITRGKKAVHRLLRTQMFRSVSSERISASSIFMS